MDDVLLYTGQFDSQLILEFFTEGVRAGFPSPAQDYMNQSLDFNQDMIEHPAATFYARVNGDSMINAGISQGDIVVIDRAVEASDGDIVLAYINEEYTLKFLDLSHREEGFILLVPANDSFQPIKVTDSDNLVIWGVVIWTIKQPTKLK